MGVVDDADMLDAELRAKQILIFVGCMISKGCKRGTSTSESRADCYLGTRMGVY